MNSIQGKVKHLNFQTGPGVVLTPLSSSKCSKTSASHFTSGQGHIFLFAVTPNMG